MSAMLPPEGMIPKDENEGHEEPRYMVLHGGIPGFEPAEPTAADMAKAIAAVFAANLLGIFLAAVVITYCWNSLIGGTTLPDFTFNQIFTVAVVLRVSALIVRL